MNSNDNKPRHIGKIQRFSSDFFRVTAYKSIMADMIVNSDSTESYAGLFGGMSGGALRGLNHEDKLAQSLSRTRSTVFEIMLCNPWEYFATFTLNPQYERDNINVFRKQFTAWVKNYNARNNLSIKYIFIPEKHKDGINWHGHGAIMGLPVEHLTAFKQTDKIPKKMKKLISKGRELYNWRAYSDKFGFVSLERIASHEATAIYITKYITKDVTKTGIEINKRMFYASKNLKRAEVLHEGEILRDYFPDFENEYVKIRTFSTLDEALMLFTDNRERSEENEYSENADD